MKRCFRISDTPKDHKNVSEFRIPRKTTKMFPKFGNPERTQKCFRNSETPKKHKDVSEFRIPLKKPIEKHLGPGYRDEHSYFNTNPCKKGPSAKFR